MIEVRFVVVSNGFVLEEFRNGAPIGTYVFAKEETMIQHIKNFLNKKETAENGITKL
jgi:hypothetical protein